MTVEIWAGLPRFDGLLEVSDLGRVRTVAREMTTWRGGKITITGRVITPRRHPWGYLWCEFMLRRQRYCEFVHRLVAEAFHGPAPDGRPYACHGDNNPQNNVPGNLRWGSPSDNSQDKWGHGTQPHGDQIWWRKVDSAEVIALRDMRAAGMRIKDLATFYGISQAQTCRICTGRQWATTDGPTVCRNKPTRFLSPDEKLLVITDRATGMTIAQLAEKHGVSRSQIHNLVRKK